MVGKGITVVCTNCGLKKIYKTTNKKPCIDRGEHIWVRVGFLTMEAKP